jgi:hypothetical protein
VTAQPSVRTCPNCGAPLELDVEGRCRWCQAFVDVPPAPAAGRTRVDPFDDQLHLEPDSVYRDHESYPATIGLVLGTFRNLGDEVAVQDYLDHAPGLREEIRNLSLALGAGGARIRDSGLMDGTFDVDPTQYLPDEIWACDLGADVIAMLAAVEGVSGNIQSEARTTVATFDKEDLPEWRRAWQQGLEAAGAGPEAFRQMRAQIPARATKAQASQPTQPTHKRHLFRAD